MNLALWRAIQTAEPSDVSEMMVAAATSIGATNVAVYLVDFEQRVLEPIGDRLAHAELPHVEEVDTTVAGRAFIDRKAEVATRPDGARVWVPIVEGSDPTGVLALTVPVADEPTVAECEDLGVLCGYLVATNSRITDLYNLHRRRKAMSLPASMQWDLLPPLTLRTRLVVAAGMVEPAYEVGGDCFDYALNGPQFDMAIMDSMGHGIGSAVVAGLAVGCYRHGRREGRPLEHIHQSLDRVVGEQCDGEGYVTGQIARLELDTGTLSIINAGHPQPLLIRGGRVIGELGCPPDVPWGVGSGDGRATVVSLEPGDTVLFYSDGVVDGRGKPYRDFGADRLTDLAGRHFSDQLPLGLIVRLLTRAVLEYHDGRLEDDATVFAVNWPVRSAV
jgi:hypothetical protein